MAGKAEISKRDERLLHTKSGNRCAMCRAVLVDTESPTAACTGENAHIYGEKPGAARYDSNKNESFVNSEKNLIFLCCSCHKKVDTDIASFPASKLFELKQAHEQWVIDSLAADSASYTFAELEVLANYLISSAHSDSNKSSFLLLNITDKIRKNELEEEKLYISMGLTSNDIIEDYLNRHPDPLYSQKLTAAMAGKYKELKDSGITSSEIFSELWKFASGYKSDMKYISAGLGILTYFFEKCEVFEK